LRESSYQFDTPWLYEAIVLLMSDDLTWFIPTNSEAELQAAQRRIKARSACSTEQGSHKKGPNKRTGKFLLRRDADNTVTVRVVWIQSGDEINK